MVAGAPPPRRPLDCHANRPILAEGTVPSIIASPDLADAALADAVRTDAALADAARAATPWTDPNPPRCTKMPFGGPKPDGVIYFTATATTDTVTVSVPSSLVETLDDAERRQRQSGHAGGVDADPTVRGLLFEVDGVDVVDPTLVAGHGRFIVVPWDYDAGCRPLPWPRAATFLPAGHRGFLSGALRDPDEWVDGVPTVDVYNPYALGHPGEPAARGRPYPAMPTADELLAFHRAMPWWNEVESRGPAAIEPAVAWLVERPEHAEGVLALTLSGLIGAVNRVDARAYDPPMVGTWRFEWTLPDGEMLTYWARTEVAPMNSARIRNYPWPRPDSTGGVREAVEARLHENGYRLWTWITFDAQVASRPDPPPWRPDTPEAVQERWTRSPFGGLAAERHDRAEAGPDGPLRVDVQLDEPSFLLPEDTDLELLRRAHFEDFKARVEAGEVIPPAGRLVRQSDGEWRLEADWTLLDGRTVRLGGERVNDLHFPRWR